MIEMEYVKLRSYSNVVSDVFDFFKEENDMEFVLIDFLLFLWQIVKGMVGLFKLDILYCKGRMFFENYCKN